MIDKNLALCPYKNLVNPVDDYIVDQYFGLYNQLLSTIGKIIRVIVKSFHLLTFGFLAGKNKLQRTPTVFRAFFQDNPLELKDRSHTFNKHHNYRLEEGEIWFRPKKCKEGAKWCKMDSLEGKFREISADGDNLIAVDDTGRVHYTKTHHIKTELEQGALQWKITNWKTSWRINWFGMPLISNILNRIKDPVLNVDEHDFQALAISHKGADAIYRDPRGKKHPDFFGGVTTLYALGLRCFFFADPYLWNHFKNEIHLPKRFSPINLAASASTIFLIGWDKNNKLSTYTRFCDHDSEGHHPLLPGTHNPNNRIPFVLYLPGETWFMQPEIPLSGKVKLTDRITIEETGNEPFDRLLRVEGTDEEGKTGYYYKMLFSKNWNFKATGHTIEPKRFLSSVKKNRSKEKKQRFKLSTCKLQYREKIDRIELRKSFGRFASIKLHIGREKIQLNLFARRGLVHWMGLWKNTPYWKLLVPQEKSNNPTVQQVINALFKGNSSVGVEIIEKNAVAIKSSYLSCRRFVLFFV